MLYVIMQTIGLFAIAPKAAWMSRAFIRKYMENIYIRLRGCLYGKIWKISGSQ